MDGIMLVTALAGALSGSFVALALIVLCLNRVFEGKLEKKFFSISTGVTT